jgi:signal transduction histidine kinase
VSGGLSPVLAGAAELLRSDVGAQWLSVECRGLPRLDVGERARPEWVAWSRTLTFAGRTVGRVSMGFEGQPSAESRAEHRRLVLVRALAVAVAAQQCRGEVVIERSAERMAALVEGTYTDGGLRGLTTRVQDLARDVIGTTQVAISVWDTERGLLKVLPAAFGTDGRSLSEMGGPAVDLRGNAARVFRTGVPYLTNQAVGDPAVHQSYVRRYGLTRLISVPLTMAGMRTGVLHLCNRASPLTIGDLRRAELLAPWVASAVELARSAESLRVRQRLDGMLAAVAVAVAGSAPLEEAIAPAIDALRASMCASVVAFTPPEGAQVVWSTGAAPAAETSEFLGRARAGVAAAACQFPRSSTDCGSAEFHTVVESAGERAAVLSLRREHGVPLAPDETDALVRLAGLVALGWAAGRSQRQRIELTRLRERQSIADDLHDRVAQILFAAQIGIDSVLETEHQGPDERARLRDVRALLTKGDNVVRAVIEQLDPVRHRSAEARLAEVLDDLAEEFGLQPRMTLSQTAGAALAGAPGHVLDCVLRVVREAAVNAAKHADPTAVLIDLDVRGDDVVVRVSDDGRGFVPDAPRRAASFGLASMARTVTAARGDLRIGPAADGTGTVVLAVLPLSAAS